MSPKLKDLLFSLFVLTRTFPKECTVCRMVWIYIFEKLKVLTGRESEMLLKKYFNLNTFLINSKNWKVPILKNPRDSVLSRQVTSIYSFSTQQDVFQDYHPLWWYS